jgi:hypothetical protein
LDRTFFSAFVPKSENGLSLDDDDARTDWADRIEPSNSRARRSFATSFLARCSPTSSRSGSVQTTSNMVMVDCPVSCGQLATGNWPMLLLRGYDYEMCQTAADGELAGWDEA